ncbi:MAG: DNA cytosine methyltransferase [Desulfovibrio sp.]|nr:DNA cytosine methyltransferase [Desulfovibrio sp.]
MSLFSGCGGMDLGVFQAGFKILARAELDKYACASLKINRALLGEPVFLYEGDIRGLDPLSLAGGERRVDLLFGGPPCQAFSQIGKKRALADERGALLFEMARFAAALRPRALLVEQVKGLLSAKDAAGARGGVFASFLTALAELGYFAKWKTLLAADYGAAQLRERVFVVAFANNSEDFSFPQPTRAAEPSPRSSLKKWVSAGEAIAGLPPPATKGASEIPADSHYDVTPPRDRARIKGVPEGRNLASQLSLPASQRGSLARKDTTKFLRVHRQKPANTLRGGEIFFHPIEDRYLTPREYMRIHGYPDEYRLAGPIRARSGTAKYLDQYRQIGNSVPPPLARAIAEKIAEALDREENGRTENIPA